MVLDSVSYVGDILSFYVDYQINELFLDTTSEIDNVMRIARQMGYKHKYSPISQGIVSFYILVSHNGSPDDFQISTAPKLHKGLVLGSEAGNRYTLAEDVDFSNEDATEVTTGPAGFMVLKAEGRVVSGLTESRTYSIGNFQKFLKLDIPRANVFEILSVTDTEGNVYYEVDHLSQNVVYTSIPNPDTITNKLTPRIMVPKIVPRRFMTEQTSNLTTLIFGYGSESELGTNVVDDPRSVALDFYGRDYITDKSFDPSRIIETDKFGIAPSNTTLTVVYSYNDSNNINAEINSVNSIIGGPVFDNDGAYQQGSLEVSNLNPIVGGADTPTMEEMKLRIFSTFAAQNRAVTREDYKALAYQMPAAFGSIRKCSVAQDLNSNRRGINYYVLAEDGEGSLTPANDALKRNLKNWINQYKMINDAVDILDGQIVNLGIEFSVLGDEITNRADILQLCVDRVSDEITKRTLEMGEPFYLTDIYTVLRQIDSVLDVLDVRLFQVTGGEYSNTVFSVDEQMSQDGRYLVAPLNVAFEFKLPVDNIRGTIR